METWFWVLGWFLSILTVVVNGFVIFLVCRKCQLRTKTKTFISGWFWCRDDCCSFTLFLQPSNRMPSTLKWSINCDFLKGVHFLHLVIAVVKPLKYLTFMKRRRIIQTVLTSWGIPFITTLTFVSSIKLSGIDFAWTINGYLYFLLEIVLCVILIFYLASMFLVVYNLNSRDHTLAKQLRFNQPVSLSQNTSASY